MRCLLCTCLLTLATLTLAAAAPHAWKDGVWASSDAPERVVVETARDVVTARLDDGADARGWIGAAGARVRYAVEGDTLFVRDAHGQEHALPIESNVAKYATTYGALGGGHYLKAVGAGGRSITLEDGSRWDIDPDRHFAVANWEADDLITVRRSTDDPAFAFAVDNTTRDEGALVNRRTR